MISKERLEKLIEQKAQVWKIYKDTCQGAYQVPAGLFGIGFSGQVDETTPFNELFETKEDVEWYKEFGCIERTERLELPTWEEFKNKDCVSFIAKTGKKINIFNYDFDNAIHISDTWYISENFEYSQDGYTLACRKAKELFLGTEDEK